MKKQYIKFIEGNQDSLDKACKLAEKHGYTKINTPDAINFEWNWILFCNDCWYYVTSCNNEEELRCTELKEPEWVYVSDESEEDALACKVKRILITILPWNTNYKYICVDTEFEEAYLCWNRYNICKWLYTVPVHTEEKKERKLIMTDSEWEEFKSRNNIKE